MFIIVLAAVLGVLATTLVAIIKATRALNGRPKKYAPRLPMRKWGHDGD